MFENVFLIFNDCGCPSQWIWSRFEGFTIEFWAQETFPDWFINLFGCTFHLFCWQLRVEDIPLRDDHQLKSCRCHDQQQLRHIQLWVFHKPTVPSKHRIRLHHDQARNSRAHINEVLFHCDTVDSLLPVVVNNLCGPLQHIRKSFTHGAKIKPRYSRT